MADTKPTKLNLVYIVYLCLLAVFCPKKLIEEEDKDNKLRNNFYSQNEKEHAAYVVCRAFWNSFGLTVLCGFVGGMIGWFLHYKFSQPPSVIITLLQLDFGHLATRSNYHKGMLFEIV